MNSTHEKIARLLLVFCTVLASTVVLCAAGWWHASARQVDVHQLDGDLRESLVASLLETSPGSHQWAFYEPAIGYTLRRSTPLAIWDDEFTSNELGYRSGPVAKAEGVFRVLFCGDSWTYGMGISEAQSFPKVIEAMANRRIPDGRRIEVWNLSLPGYNGLQQLKALWFFFDRLQPDAVVLCPCTNDNNSRYTVLPNGSTWGDGLSRDGFGHPHAMAFHLIRVDSHLFVDRRRQVFTAIRKTEQRLGELGIPFHLLFVARWAEPEVAYHLQAAGIAAPFAIVPMCYTTGEWLNQSAASHGTPEANRVYARVLYPGLAQQLGWPPLEQELEIDSIRHPGGGLHSQDWSSSYSRLLRRATREAVPTSFEPGARANRLCMGSINANTGVMGHAATILLRRERDVRALEVCLRPLPAHPSLYPLEVACTIPSPSGNQTLVVTVSDRSEQETCFELPLPPDIAPGSAVDLVLQTDRCSVGTQRLRAESVLVAGVEQI